MPTKEQTIELLKSAIPWNRLWHDSPVYLHSVAVWEILEKHGFSEDVVNAGYLHDIVEDGGYTFAQLKELWYSDLTVSLVDFATHNMQEKDPYIAWSSMIERMVQAENKDAWAVKIADMLHNISECFYCTDHQRKTYLFFKAPVFIYYGNKYFADHSLYADFLETYWQQVKRFHKYFT